MRRFKFVGVEDGKGNLLTDGEEEVGRGIKVGQPAVTHAIAGGLHIRYERRPENLDQ
jgi:hypothetical protein